MNFIKNIKENKIDEWTHMKFIRYSPGTFEKETFKITKGSNFVQIKAGFEYLDVMFKLMADCVKDDVDINGVLVTKKDVIKDLEDMGIEILKKTGKKYTIKQTLSAAKFKEFVDKFSQYSLLFKIKSGRYSISVKKSVPKPGKVVEGFVSAKFELKDLDKIHDTFLFDWKDKNFKKAEIKHTYVIDDINIPKEFENDPAQARLKSIRKGKIIRTIDVDGKTEKVDIDMEV